MASPCSIDLRERVLDYIDEGHTKEEASIIFKITTRVIYNWQALRRSGESLEPKVRKSSPKKLEPEKVIELVKANPEGTLKEYGKEFGASGVAIHKAFKKLGITRKKNRSYISKETKKNANNFKKK